MAVKAALKLRIVLQNFLEEVTQSFRHHGHLREGFERDGSQYPSYQAIFLAEYFLQTGDKRVLPTIEENCKRLYLSQVIDPELYKDAIHGGQPQAKNFLKGGNGHGARIEGYGTMSPRIHPTAAMVLALGTDKPKLRIQGVNGKPQP